MMKAVDIATLASELLRELPLEQLEKRLLAHPAATRFDTSWLEAFEYDAAVLRVIYWSEEHQQRFVHTFELRGKNILDVLPTDTIDFIVKGFNNAADDALAQGPGDEVLDRAKLKGTKNVG